MEKVESKVHINGRFTTSIKLERGVRQGCPLLALLFTISSQPLMLMIKAKVQSGKLEGITQDNGDQLTHQLFVDDTSLFFTTKEGNFACITEIIKRYERISSAALNLSKLMVVPLYLKGPIPNWLLIAGRKVVERREVISYLNYPIGHEITPTMEVDFLLGKVRKRLNP